ncbi:phosphorylase family protein [Microbacterium sp. NPDC055903]
MKLLVAALESELVAFPAEVPGYERLITGPGKIKAAYALTRALDAGDYDEILVVGTAGAIDPDIAVGVHSIDKAFQYDVIDDNGIAGHHVSMPQSLTLGGGDVVIATGDSFVDDADTVLAIRALGGRLVDMEAYVYTWVAGQFGVPIRIWKAVSDSAQDGANQTWEQAVAVCSRQLWERLQTELDA